MCGLLDIWSLLYVVVFLFVVDIVHKVHKILLFQDTAQSESADVPKPKRGRKKKVGSSSHLVF